MALKDGGYGGLIGVGMGSTRPPRLVRLSYTHPEATRTVAFVGKGITFDSGGLSLKPPKSMETMKCDMSGAAAVLAATYRRRRPRRCRSTSSGTCAPRRTCRAAPRSGRLTSSRSTAARPSRCSTPTPRAAWCSPTASPGPPRTIPVLIVDVATLTGAATVALGRRTAGVMGSSDEVAARGRRGHARRRASPPGRCRSPRSCARGWTPPSPT